MSVVVTERIVEGIPLLELVPSPAPGALPVVLLHHGYMGRKEFLLAQAYAVARLGYATLVPDALGHGDRQSGPLPDLLSAILGTAAEIDGILDAYAEDPRVDVGRFATAGYSMGGCIVYRYLVEGRRRPRAAVPIISTPDWVSIVDAFDTPEGRDELVRSGTIRGPGDLAAMRARAREVQPAGRPERMAGVPLLMLCGREDRVTPPAGSAALEERLRPLVADPDTVRRIVYDGVGHADTLQMNLELHLWLKRYLH